MFKIVMVVSNMVQEMCPEGFNHEVKADKHHSQILIKVTNSSKTFKEAKKIIEDLGIHIIKTERLKSNWTLLKLDVKDMRDVALKLTEHGFFIKGINALP
jgi:hypothetical protein